MSANIERDIELAKDIRDAVTVLNKAIQLAHDAGLKIDITDEGVRTVGRLDLQKVYHVEVYRTI